jgi:NADPH-dependent F420 reductase
MKIGIIGTGNMASALGKAWAAKGHEVVFGSRTPDKALELAKKIGSKACAGTIAEAAAYGDVVALAVPYREIGPVLSATGALLGKTVIDLTNPLSEDYMGLTLGHTTSAAEEIAKLIPGARVVKAFNTIFAQVIADPVVGGTRATVFYAGDDAPAKEVVAGLIWDVGFDPVDAGNLANARFLEPLAALMVQLGFALGHGPTVAPRLLRR